MGDQFKRAKPGERLTIPARAYNAFIDAAIANDTKARGGSGDAVRDFNSSGIVLVKNASGSDRERFEVLGIDEPIILPSDDLTNFKSRVTFRCVTPTDEHKGRFVVLLEPLAAGKLGRAVVSGVCIARITGGSENHNFADAADGETSGLTAGAFGSAQILWRDEESDWSVVRLGNGDGIPYALDDCKRTTPTIYVTNDLEDSLGKVVKVNGRCYRVRRPRSNEMECVAPACAAIAGVYESCQECAACYKLVRCGEPSEVKYANNDLSQAVGKVVRLPDGYCYTVSQAENCLDATPVSVAAVYDSCTACTHCYTLSPCWGGGDSITISNDLAAFMQFEPEDVIGRVVEIDGECWTVTGYGEECSTAQSVSLTQHYTECTDCGCYDLTECQAEDDETPPDVIKAHSAVDENGDAVDLSAIVGQSVRLNADSEKSYTVSRTTNCEGATEVTILEAYDGCDDAKCYEVKKCGEEESVVTYSDLSSFSVGQVLKSGEDCYELIGEAPWNEDAIGLDLGENPDYPSCDSCNRVTIYKLSGVGCSHPGCGEDGDGAPDDILTREDLHAAVDRFVKVNGVCYRVQTWETPDPVDDAPLAYQGPYDTCELCQEAPLNARHKRVTRIYVEGNVLKYDVEEDVIVDGLVVGTCFLEPQTVESTTCPDGEG